MSLAYSNFEYQFGGSLDSNAPTYVTRQADAVFYKALKAGQFCYVLNSRQMGKSSLRVRAMQRLQREGTVCAFIDLTGMGKQDLTPEKWYAGIIQSLVSSCLLHSNFQWRTWWRERQDLLSPVQRLSLFLEEVLLAEVKQNIVIFVDEIDRVLSQTFSLDDFFALIRFCLEQRNVKPQYQRLNFALLGVATPRDLMRDKSQTPFNIGTAIELQGFQLHEVHALTFGLEGKVAHPTVVMQDILEWTGGQPFLTQKLCQLVAAAAAAHSFISVEQVVRSQVLENWEFQDEPEHLRTIRDRILRNQSSVGRLLGLYQQILERNEIAADGSPEQMELRLTGLVVEHQGKLKVYNRICQSVFDRRWVEQKFAELRPYASAIADWFASGAQNEAFLLRGQPLQEALTWALGKNLSDKDFQFLVASQNLAKQQTQIALEATEQASQLLASARQKAKKDVLSQRLHWGWIPVMTLAVTLPILLLRFAGLLQGLEWNLLDQFFRWRSLEPPDTRIAVVSFNESDLAKVGGWPINDRVLAKTLAKIKSQKPRAMGLDIYRNFPVEPGHRELVQLFGSTPNLFGIEKAVGTQIPPSAELSQLDRVGIADQVQDADGKVRRALLAVDDDRYSLAARLVLHYLAEEKVDFKRLDENRALLGKTILHRFEGNDGGYVRTQSGGYQILLNFRGPQRSFPTYSLQQVLKGLIPPHTFRDRIVLIGTTADSLNDIFYTPYSGGLFRAPEPMAGVTLHANIVSQLLSAALNGRPSLQTWSDPVEGLWIMAWAGCGAAIGWRLKSSRAIALCSILAGGVLMGGCFALFLGGWWSPVVPSLLALLGTAAALPIAASRQRDKLLFQRTVAGLLEGSSHEPTATRIAFEYLKQSETKENQAWIEHHLNAQGKATE
jgi:adenylate cyclase